jgi:hypothetical protein
MPPQQIAAFSDTPDGGSIIGYHSFGTVDPIWQIQP